MYVLCKDGLFNTLFTTHNGMETIQFRSTYFGQFLCPSSGVFRCTHSNGICHTPDDGQRNCPKQLASLQAVSKPV